MIPFPTTNVSFRREPRNSRRHQGNEISQGGQAGESITGFFTRQRTEADTFVRPTPNSAHPVSCQELCFPSRDISLQASEELYAKDSELRLLPMSLFHGRISSGAFRPHWEEA